MEELRIETPSMEELKSPEESHRCFSVQELCSLRQALELPLVQALRLQTNLGVGCATCWSAVDEVRGTFQPEVKASTSPDINMLRTLTAPPNRGRSPGLRQALQEVRTAEFGVLRLLYQEVVQCTWGDPAAAIAELEYVVALLGDPPSEPQERAAWHDFRAELESVIAGSWAHSEKPKRAAAALERAAVHRSKGTGSTACAVTWLMASGKCKFFYDRVEVAAWLPPYAQALKLLTEEEDDPRILALLYEVGCLLAGARQPKVAHGILLIALRLAGELGAEFPGLHLGVLHDLVKLELAMAHDARNDPPTFGLLHSLAMVRLQRTSMKYLERGDPEMAEEAVGLCIQLMSEDKRLATTKGLRRSWRKLVRSRAVEALPGFEYLGLAAVMGDDSFVALHRAEVRQAFADSPVARGRLREFRQELQRLLEAGDWACRV